MDECQIVACTLAFSEKEWSQGCRWQQTSWQCSKTPTAGHGPGWDLKQVRDFSPQPPHCRSRWPPQRLACSGHLASHCLHLRGHCGAGLVPALPVLALLAQALAPDRWPQQSQGGELHVHALQSWLQALGELAWGWQRPAAGLPAAEWRSRCCWHCRQAVAIPRPHEALAGGAEPRHLPEQQHSARAAHFQQDLKPQQQLPPLNIAWHPGQAEPKQELHDHAAPAGGPAWP